MVMDYLVSLGLLSMNRLVREFAWKMGVKRIAQTAFIGREIGVSF